MVATRGAGPTAASKLKFKEKLNGSNDVLQKKLKTLYEELAMLEQGSVDTASLNAVRKELITAHLILHKDKGVKAHVACCLAEILRLYAPDAPYTAPELRDMFQFFFRQLGQNFKTGSPYYHQYFLLIESLSTVKSIVLVCDLPNSDELISILFREFFALIRPDDLGKNVEIYMSDMLVAVIDEAQTIPNDTVKNILAQFLPDAPEPAQRLASSVCNQTSDKLQRHVVQYFTDIMLSHAGANEDESEEEEHGLDFTAIRTAHNLIRSISLSAPSLLHNVIPQLETELRAEEVSLRSLATQTLGAMFSHPKTGSDLIKKYPTCWKAWSQRKVDKVPAVRVAWTEASKAFFYGPQELKEEIEGQ
jgi:sister-chromatid-cohesion protein PDS5